MRLKKLELSGFKSFAKHTTLEFPAQVSGIVGPNGSGKSNVVESIRWALGEQAFKNLRGKKSEDFIFNGSLSVPKMGKASATLFFDAEKRPDFEYDEIIITRRVYRDGANEYLINNSQVRLKDIIELLSRFGLGASGHHIISQGEADRILSVSLKERREMLEDALGLKIYQLKRQEAERKLKKTEENINQVGSLRKEIQPHLKFLKKQVEKAEKALNFREKLKELCLDYFSREKSFLEKEFSRLKESHGKPSGELKTLEEKIRNLRSELGSREEKRPPVEISKLEKELEEARLKRVSLERDLGRCEGMIELQEARQRESGKEIIERSAVEKFLNKLDQYLEEGFLEPVFKKIKKAVEEFSEEMKIRKQNVLSDEIEELKKKKSVLASGLEESRKKEEEAISKLSASKAEIDKTAKREREAERELYDAELKASNFKNFLKSFEVEEERLKRRKEEMEQEMQSAIHFIGSAINLNQKPDSGPEMTFSQREEARREIERLKIRLEDSEGIGEDVLKEYGQVKARDDFFEKELGDLDKAALSLRDLMKELSEKIDVDFKKGAAEINKEFQNFFTLMFGGGTAELKVVKISKNKRSEDSEGDEIEAGILPEDAEEEETEENGVEISVNIPRKRIRSLEMLSGGERALTSIALLFAMTQVNPPPFLILDETDAALDESNSQKYAKMLKDLSQKTQLIIITHNRETMKQAGILYGVTLGSTGVSQILSIKFDEAEELAAQDKT